MAACVMFWMSDGSALVLTCYEVPGNISDSFKISQHFSSSMNQRIVFQKNDLGV